MHTHIVLLSMRIMCGTLVCICASFSSILAKIHSMHGDQPLCYVNIVFVIINAIDIKKLTANAQNYSRLILVHMR